MDQSTIVTAGIALVLLVVIAANSYLRYRRKPVHDDITTNNEPGVIEAGRFTKKLR